MSTFMTPMHLHDKSVTWQRYLSDQLTIVKEQKMGKRIWIAMIYIQTYSIYIACGGKNSKPLTNRGQHKINREELAHTHLIDMSLYITHKHV